MSNAELVAYQLGVNVATEGMAELNGPNPQLTLDPRPLLRDEAGALDQLGAETFAYWTARGARDAIAGKLCVERMAQDGS